MKKIGKEIITTAIVAIILIVVCIYWLLPSVDAMAMSYLKVLAKSFLIFTPAIGIFSCALYFARKNNDEKRVLFCYRFLLLNIILLITCCLIGVVSFSFLPILSNSMVAFATSMAIALVVCYILYLHKKF
ncbi:MAG: hypothetical protein J5900_05330 [Prevotella sp.]|nr:hypothetical protein [Prevotella sp.]